MTRRLGISERHCLWGPGRSPHGVHRSTFQNGVIDISLETSHAAWKDDALRSRSHPVRDRPFVIDCEAAHLEISEAPQEVLVRAEVPGFRADDLAIAVESGRLLISGRKDLPVQEAATDPAARCGDQFFCTTDLPRAVDSAGVRAWLDEGMLRVMLPNGAAATRLSARTDDGSLRGRLEDVGRTRDGARGGCRHERSMLGQPTTRLPHRSRLVATPCSWRRVRLRPVASRARRGRSGR